MLKVLCSKLKRIIKYKEYPVSLRNKNLNKDQPKKDEVYDNLNTQIRLQQGIIKSLTTSLESTEAQLAQTKKQLIQKDKLIEDQTINLQSKLSQIEEKNASDKQKYSTIIKSLLDRNEKLNTDLALALTKAKNTSPHRHFGIIGSNLQNQGNNSNSVFAFGL